MTNWQDPGKIYSFWTLNVYGSGSTGYTQAPRNSVTASSVVGSGWEASKAKDSDNSTAWSSAQDSQTGIEWIYIDMGQNYDIRRVRLYPRNANGTVYCFPVDFKFQYSTNGSNWTDVPGQNYTGYPAPGNSEQVFFFGSEVTARYLRLYGKKFSIDNSSSYYMQIAEFNADY